tara:strand:+ start:219 stop:404 length:186 start_codon:yes stop_codon:yes gene_type:complete
MQFYKKTRSGVFTGLGKFLIKIMFVVLILFISLILIDRIDFPSPNNKIQKVVPNENFRIIK